MCLTSEYLLKALCTGTMHRLLTDAQSMLEIYSRRFDLEWLNKRSLNTLKDAC